MTDLSIHTSGPHAAVSEDAAKRSDSGDFGTLLDTVLDIVNPLQHLPVVSTLYRSLTGDEIAAPARVVGGALFGGPIGAASAVVNLAVEDATGQDIGEHALALLTGDDADDDMQLASLDGTPPPPPRRTPVMVAYGDHAAMMPDYETWNGEWQTPAGAAMAQTAGAAPAAAATVARAPQLPGKSAQQEPQSPLPSAAQAADSTPPAMQADAPATPQAAAPDTAPDTAAAEPPLPPTAQAPTPSPSTAAANAPKAPPAWLAAALANAEAEAGGDAARSEPAGTDPESPEWISAAMAHALDKYQAMAIARSGERDATKTATSDAVDPQ